MNRRMQLLWSAIVIAATCACNDSGGSAVGGSDTAVDTAGDAFDDTTTDGDDAVDVADPDSEADTPDGADTAAADAVDIEADPGCVASSTLCRGPMLHSCQEGTWREVDCSPGACATGPFGSECGPACDSAEVGCFDDDSSFVCDRSAESMTVVDCAAGNLCRDGVCLEPICEPDTSTCDGVAILSCNSDGSALTVTACASVESCADSEHGCLCESGECVPRVCRPGDGRCVGNSRQACDELGFDYLDPEACGDDVCVAGACLPVACTPGDRSCAGDTLILCGTDGERSTIDCRALDLVCTAAGGDADCGPQVCEPDAAWCSPDFGAAVRCDPRGASSEEFPCAAGTYCSAGYCLPQVCDPSEPPICVGGDVIGCDAIGSAVAVLDACESGAEVCHAGSCLPIECEPSSVICRGTVRVECDGLGLVQSEVDCAAEDAYCDPETGLCVPVVCDSAGAEICLAGDVQRCREDGSGYQVVRDCADAGCTAGACDSVCGDGAVEADEECDDGGANSDDVPDACRMDCTVARCGDGVVDSGEGCDDGNVAPGDCCDEACADEVTPECDPCEGTCAENEVCDDGVCVCACAGDACLEGTCFVVTSTADVTAAVPIVYEPFQADLVFNVQDSIGFASKYAVFYNAIVFGTTLSEMAGRFESPAYGYTRFTDFGCTPYGSGFDLPFTLVQRVTTDVSTFRSMVRETPSAGSGNDYPASGYESLFQIATGAGVTACETEVLPFDPSAGLAEGVADGTIGGVGFRDGSRPVVLHVGESPSHDSTEYGAGAASEAEALEAMADLGAIFIALTSSSAIRTELAGIARATGSRVPPCAFPWDTFDECGEGLCCTGLNGAWRAPDSSGLCPLVFEFDTTDGMREPLVRAVDIGSRFVSRDVRVVTLPDDSLLDSGVDTSCLVARVEVVAVGDPPGGCGFDPATMDFDEDGVVDGATGVTAGVSLDVSATLHNGCSLPAGTYDVSFELLEDGTFRGPRRTIHVVVTE